MDKIGIGINLEFVRHDDKSFEWGVARAAELGYTHVEPMVHWGRELLSEAGYFHSVSMHAKDISVQQSGAQRGKATGMPVGCACGDCVIDWDKVIDIVHKGRPRDIVLSVECGTTDQAARSIQHLSKLL